MGKECIRCIICEKEIEKKGRWKLKKFCSERCKEEKNKRRMLSNYYKQRDKILKYQIERLEKLRKENKTFQKKYKLRHNSCHRISLNNKHCEECKSKKDLQRHHPNYNTSDTREIKILCRKCHNKLHQTLKEI